MRSPSRWPACQPPNAKPQQAGADCGGITPPTIGIQAHSAPLGLAFYSGTQFPAPYRGNYFFADYVSGFVALLDMANGNGAYAFASGFDSPVDLLVGTDGALYVLTRSSVARITAP